MIRRRHWLIAAAALAVLPVSIAACSGNGSSGGKSGSVDSGEMPSGAEWTGVYYSELYGWLHMVQEGGNVNGKWIRPVKDRWGELHGEAHGDVVKFTWTEHVVGRVGPQASRNGKGYFKYKRPPGDNVDDTIAGEIGVGKDETGEPWDAVKQRNMLPDLASIGGSGASDLGGGDWDSQNREKGAPEAPAPPKK